MNSLCLLLKYSLALLFSVAFVACSTPTVSSDDSNEADLSSSSLLGDKLSSSSKGDVEFSSESRDSSSLSGDLIGDDTFVDERDGKVYKMVKIGDQVWMAENLNYATAKGSFCYGNDADNCIKYGKLYTWTTAVGKSESECGEGKICSLGEGNVQGVCPAEWHLPSKAEWEALIVTVDGNIAEYSDTNAAGKALKSQKGWYEGGDGTDAFGFSALPAGTSAYSGFFGSFFLHEGSYAYFWSATEYDGDYSYDIYMFFNNEDAFLGYGGKESATRSVRCLKD